MKLQIILVFLAFTQKNYKFNIEVIIDGFLKDHIVKINGFGTFKLRRKKSRIGRNPKNGKEYLISDRNVVTFYPSNKVKLFMKKQIKFIKL